jgi:hypothetical protein
MLKENTPNICVFVLNTGAEVIAKVTDENDHYWMIEKPLQIAGLNKEGTGIQFAHCFLMLSVAKSIPLRKDGVITFGPAIKDIEASYERTISDIIVPPKSPIIV